MRTTHLLILVAACVASAACSSKSGGSPPEPPPPDPAVSISLGGGDFSCAVLTSGAVRCWGWNDVGQLGNPAGFGSWSLLPVPPGVSAPAKLDTGSNHACASLAAGAAVCWGAGTYGELGNGAFANSMSPVTVTSVARPLDLSAGLYHSCAVVSDRTVKCWGGNEFGQLGDPSLATIAPNNRFAIPVTATGITGAQAITAGGGHSCALLDDATVKCWGGPMNGPSPYRNDPVTISSLVAATSVAAGLSHDCAVVSGGKVKCWGKNVYGQVGNGSVVDSPTEAVFVTSIDSATAVAAGAFHSCALLADGTVSCWGRNNRGELGDGTDADRSIPVVVSGLTGALAIGAGAAHTCALVTGGVVKCWGDNLAGQLGLDPAVTPLSKVPVTVAF